MPKTSFSSVFGRHVIRIDLHHVVGALALGLQNLQRLVGVARRDDAVGHLTRQIAGHIGVAHVGQRRPVAVGAQAVGAAGANVGAGDGRELALLFHEVHGAVGLGEGMAHSGPSRGHMLEGSGRRQPRGLLQLLHKLPGVEGVEEVDEAGLAVQHLNGQIAAVLHEDARRLLIRIAAVLEFQFVHESPILMVSVSSGGEATRYSDSLRQSSLCGNAHWAFPVAAELARSEHPVSSLSSTVVESAQFVRCGTRLVSGAPHPAKLNRS